MPDLLGRSDTLWRVFSACGLAAVVALVTATPAQAGATATPNLTSGSAYLTAPANLVGGHFYESFPGYADFGLTVDGALALAATGDEDPALKGIVTFLDSDGKDPHGHTINTWTGVGTSDVSGGSLGDEALLAEATGYDPRGFAGHNVITALNASVCTHTSPPGSYQCAGAGNYSYADSTFDQSTGIIAQLRAGQAGEAAAPIRFLEGLRNSDGSFPSLIPDSHDQDVDSTAMAVMALALAGGATAAADVKTGLAWIASRQVKGGGFPGAAGDSVNSAGLAIQALTLEATEYRPRIDAALAFLAGEQNSNGGFDVAAGQHGSNVRASTQALGGAVGTSFATLYRSLTTTRTPPPSHSPTGPPAPPRSASPQSTVTVTQTVAPTPSPSASAAPTPAAAAPASSSAAPRPPARGHARMLADVSDDSSLTTDLWWAVLGVAAAAALVIGLLFVRRRRLYPGAGGAA
jgi:hypothetical protein